jgi:hypothetical protein
MFSMWGLRKSTRFPTFNCFSLTFGSLHALVSSWYFSRFVTALSLSDSIKFFSSASLGHGVLSAATCKLRCLILSDSIAYVLYINQKGVKFVALQTIVLWLYTSIGMASAHFFPLPPISSSLHGKSKSWLFHCSV